MGKKAKKLENKAKSLAKQVAKEPVPEIPQVVPTIIFTANPNAAAPVTKKETPIVKAKETEAAQHGIGYVIEIVSDNNKVLYWKVVTPHPISNEFVTALAYKPAISANIGAKIQLDLIPYFNKWSATNVVLLEDVSEITPYAEQMESIENEVEETNAESSLFPSQIAGLLLQSPHRSGNLCQDLGYTQILGRVRGGSKIQLA